MSDKVILVTAPDDVLSDGVRLLLVDLTREQQQLISDALKELVSPETTVVYLWTIGHDTDWLLDKKPKCDLIIFNADSDNHLLVGYMAAQPNSHYIGSLRIFADLKDPAIYSIDQIINLMEKAIVKNGKI